MHLFAYGTLMIAVGKVKTTDAIQIHEDGDGADTFTALTTFTGAKDRVTACVVGDMLHLMWGTGGNVYHARYDLGLAAEDKAQVSEFAGSMPSMQAIGGGNLIVHYVGPTGNHESRISVTGGDSWMSANEVDSQTDILNVDASSSPLSPTYVSWANEQPA